MRIAEGRSVLAEHPQIPGEREQQSRNVRTVLDTTELRWFVPGRVPADIVEWFGGSTGVAEERCDTYLVDGLRGIGVKRRFGETIELKVRQSLGERMQFGVGLAGSLETWRRWSPAEGLVDDNPDGRWVDVCKSIFKRRFSIDGTEILFSSTAPVDTGGCDVEVAEVAVGPVRTWTFAFAAFGPPGTRRDALLASWQGLAAGIRLPVSLGRCAGRSMGYPEWLARGLVS